MHETSGFQIDLGDGLTLTLDEQEQMAVDYLRQHRAELQRVTAWAGADICILGFQYVIAIDESVVGFSLGPSTAPLACAIEVGVRPNYYVTVDRRRRSDRKQRREP